MGALLRGSSQIIFIGLQEKSKTDCICIDIYKHELYTIKTKQFNRGEGYSDQIQSFGYDSRFE